jgi:hypothetical protein
MAEEMTVQRIRIQKPRARRERSWREALPPGPRDPDVVRAKALARARNPRQQVASHAVAAPRAADAGGFSPSGPVTGGLPGAGYGRDDRARTPCAKGFSLSGGHVFRVAADNPQLAAAIAQTPNADGPAAARNAARHQKPLAMLRFAGRSTLDALGGLAGRPPLLIPLAGQPGTVAMLTTPDSLDGDRALNPGNKCPDRQQAVAARSALQIGLYRPGRDASRVRCPLLVLVCDRDQTALAGPAVSAANRTSRGELVQLPGGQSR